MGLLVVQVVLGGYQLSIVADAGRRESTARATRLPNPAVFGHLVTGVLGTILWIVWLATNEHAITWITLVVLVAGGGLGLFMFARTAGRTTITSTDAVRYPDRADVVAAEKRIPGISLAFHGLLATLLLVFALLVALGVGN